MIQSQYFGELLISLGKVWDTLDKFTKESKGINGSYTKICGEVVNHVYMNNGKRLPKKSREISIGDLGPLIADYRQELERVQIFQQTMLKKYL